MNDAFQNMTALDAALAPHGLRMRGALSIEADDQVPDWDPVREHSLFLVGNTGPAMERVFRDRAVPESTPDPLDVWTRKVIEPLARAYGGRALYPFSGPPFLPFSRWALKTGTVYRSPLGMLIHPTYGLWHAYRAALVLPELQPEPYPRLPHPCAVCTEKPCLSACPVGAFSGADYQVSACRTHLSSSGNACMEAGCLARRACPVGSRFHYGPLQTRFHMRAFKDG